MPRSRKKFMTVVRRAAGAISLVINSLVLFAALSPSVHAAGNGGDVSTKNTAAVLIRQMAGTWDVQQRMWPGAGAKVVELPAAVAHRRLVAGAYVEETMEVADKSAEPFTRTAYFNYNTVNQQYEYFSIDSRAPQMMQEKSLAAEPPDKDGIRLYGGSFVAPRWGDAANAAFMYRLTVGPVEKDRQLVRLFLTPQSGEAAKEFLAFEYVYTRRR